MAGLKRFFSTRKGIVFTGILIGIVAPLLQRFGNPPNMGICIACFERDIAGALGLHRATVVQYLRPEIMAIAIGSFFSSLLFREFRPRTGSSPLIRFMLGFFGMVGALIFLGCPWRALIRLSAGDLNAVLGILGLVAGIWTGAFFLQMGYNPGRKIDSHFLVGSSFAIAMAFLLFLLFYFPPVSGQQQSDIIFYSVNGPGSMHAPYAVSIAFGLLIGFVMQRSRFCSIGGIRDLILYREAHLFLGVAGLVAAAFFTNLFLGQFHAGFSNQPIAHTESLWNFLGMLLAGLCFTLAGGCPARQLVLAAEGDGDSALFVFGMIMGAAFSHNFGLASSPKGIGPHALGGLITGLAFCLLVGFTMRRR
jgi:YedE family putative selenium metabolism protein